MAADCEPFRIYIILDKVCRILHAFGLNSMVCSHVVDVPSGQVTYDFMMDADLYNSFLLQLSVYISLWYYILVQFVMSS